MDPAQCSTTWIYSVAVYSLGWYDWLICLPSEYRLLWKRKRFGAVEFGYFMARYYTLIVIGICIGIFGQTVSPGKCGHWNLVIPLIDDVSTWACDLVIALRCWAIWGRSPKVGVLLSALWLAEVGLMITALPFYHNLADVIGAPAACIPVGRTSKPSLTLLTWISPAFFCLTLLGLTSIKAWQLYRQGGNNSLLTLLVRDGALYAGVVFVIYTINAVFFAQRNANIQATNAIAAFTLPGIIVSRMILRLRQAGEDHLGFRTTASAFIRPVFGMTAHGSAVGPQTSRRDNTVLVEISRTQHEEAGTPFKEDRERLTFALPEKAYSSTDQGTTSARHADADRDHV